MTVDRPVLVRCALITVTYALVLFLVVWFWAASDSTHWAGGFRPLHVRVMVGFWQAFGPFAFVMIYPDHPILIVSIIWSLWLAIVFASQLRSWPIAMHFLMAVLWCVCGLPPASLVIT